mmetsp:Transcript_52359/g.122840  ORF Transcript_52359/g.122840 Transcript_52359/m.122840 type:complete len:83 (+) Transcript_52359:288-536(+)
MLEQPLEGGAFRQSAKSLSAHYFRIILYTVRLRSFRPAVPRDLMGLCIWLACRFRWGFRRDFQLAILVPLPENLECCQICVW